jgi:glutathione S-transferase
MSTASRFVRLILSEYGYQTELAEEQPWERRRDFLTLNPAGTLPVYVDDSMRALCGATVISEYLDETNGVLKRDRRLPLVRERIFKLQMTPDQGGGAPDSKVLRTSRSNIRQHLKYLGWLAGSRTYLAGDRLSYADLAAAAAISVLDYLGEIDWSEAPPVKDWYQRLKSRPSFRPLLAERVRGVTPVSHYADLDF